MVNLLLCEWGGSLLPTSLTKANEPSTAASGYERKRVSKCYTPTQRPRHTQPQPRPSCHYLPGTTTTLRLIPQNLHCAISLKIFCTHLKLKHSLEWWEFLINLINSFLQSVLDFFLRCTI